MAGGVSGACTPACVLCCIFGWLLSSARIQISPKINFNPTLTPDCAPSHPPQAFFEYGYLPREDSSADAAAELCSMDRARFSTDDITYLPWDAPAAFDGEQTDINLPSWVGRSLGYCVCCCESDCTAAHRLSSEKQVQPLDLARHTAGPVEALRAERKRITDRIDLLRRVQAAAAATPPAGSDAGGRVLRDLAALTRRRLRGLEAEGGRIERRIAAAASAAAVAVAAAGGGRRHA